MVVFDHFGLYRRDPRGVQSLADSRAGRVEGRVHGHRVDSEKAHQPQGRGDDSLYRNHFPVRFRHFGGYSATVRIKFFMPVK